MTMSTDPHDAYEELAAGYALNALEPADEQAFLDHLDGCSRCAEAAHDFGEVAGALGGLSVMDVPPADVWQNIDRAIAADAGEPDAAVVSIDSRRRWTQGRARTLTAAAAVVAIAGVGGWLIADHYVGSSPSRANKLQAACARSTTCHAIRLVGSGNQAQAVVLIDGQRVTLVDNRLAAIDPSQQTYVLWQLPRAGRPLGIVSFAVTRDHPQPIVNATLPESYESTAAIAVSRETGTTIPAAPSTTLGVAAAN
jgi:anti-sigma-K factor RskA